MQMLKISVALMIMAGSAMAQQIGQFQVVPLPKGSEGCCSHDALIVDTVTGHLWKWTSGMDAQGKGVEVLRYQGQAIPNKMFINGNPP
jgi:hypothetical protein